MSVLIKGKYYRSSGQRGSSRKAEVESEWVGDMTYQLETRLLLDMGIVPRG